MAKILILFAHPALEKSRVHNRLLKSIKSVEGVTFHDLYEAYPDFDVDVKREQQLLVNHDLVIFQHPFYWYSTPALIKQWEDLVLEHGWAYGTNGNALAGKSLLCVISAGGSMEAYRQQGRNKYTIRQLLAPLEQTAQLCKMNFLPPFIVHGTHRLSLHEIDLFAIQYTRLLNALAGDHIGEETLKDVSYMNELFPIHQLLNPGK
jgi:glutathione-regulated potassium-efflux system ancillary protein KefG